MQLCQEYIRKDHSSTKQPTKLTLAEKLFKLFTVYSCWIADDVWIETDDFEKTYVPTTTVSVSGMNINHEK